MELKVRVRQKVKPDMDWSWNETTTTFLPQVDPSYSFFYNNNNQNSGMEVKQPALSETSQRLLPSMDGGSQEKKRRLTNDQMESLERSFQEEIKLDPERKMKLSRELGLQPRQIAVWFQNRRSRWKTKQLEHLYDVLRQEFDVISREKHKLQQEVLMLKARLREQQGYNRMQTLAGYTEISGEERTLEALRGSKYSSVQQAEEGYSSFTMEDYNTVSILPYYP